MSRPRRGTEQVFYDTFADWPAEDQAAALKVLEALHRQKQRMAKEAPAAFQKTLAAAAGGSGQRLIDEPAGSARCDECSAAAGYEVRHVAGKHVNTEAVPTGREGEL